MITQESKSPSFRSINRARQRLIETGICALDGSGDTNVEALFQRIAVVRKNLKELRADLLADTFVDNKLARAVSQVDRCLSFL